MMVASTKISSKEELKHILENSPRIEEINYIKEVSTKEPYSHKEGKFDFNTFDYSIPKTDKRVVVLDFGVKRNILNELVGVGLEVEVLPNSTDINEVIERFKSGDIAGVFLSMGLVTL